jgi:hypothetical protein
MIKKICLLTLILSLFTVAASPIELGIIGGSIDHPSETVYGFSVGSGFMIPLLKFEAEYYNLTERKWEALTVGIKVRKRIGNIAPYGILGAGAEFKNLTFKFSNHEYFFFVGGGLHFFVGSVLSVRADLRFQNFSDQTKTRFTVGLFFHL